METRKQPLQRNSTMLEKLLRYAQQNGMDARIIGDYVEVDIAWVHFQTRETGVEKFRIQTLCELRSVLGY